MQSQINNSKRLLRMLHCQSVQSDLQYPVILQIALMTMKLIENLSMNAIDCIFDVNITV